jgi:toxin FitB
MTILDTNVLSALMRVKPEPLVVTWLNHQPPESIWVTSITIYEVRFGIELLPTGRKRMSLSESFQSFIETIDHRIAAFDAAAGEQAANLMACRQKAGRPIDLRDTMIAGIALARRATLATRNVAHFVEANISVIDPWAH